MTRPPRPPLQPGWVLVDGLPVFHRSYDPDGHAATAVHVHGFAISGTYLEPTAALLASRYRTFVPDLPGMGRSVRPPHRLDVPGLARSLVGYLDAVGVERASFVGNSLGCPIVMELASAFPDRIERAVLVSPTGGPHNRPLLRALRQMAVLSTREPPAMLLLAARDYVGFGIGRSVTLFRSMTRFPTIDRLQHMTIPTLVVTGTRDPLVDHSCVALLSDLPQVQAVRLCGAHALNFSRPAPLADLIGAFIEGRPLPPAADRHLGVEVVTIPPSPRLTARRRALKSLAR